MLIHQTISNFYAGGQGGGGGASHLSQNGQPFSAQPNFHTHYKSDQCSPKHKIFFLCVSYERRDLLPYMYENWQKMFHIFLNMRDNSKLSTFFETLSIL